MFHVKKQLLIVKISIKNPEKPQKLGNLFLDRKGSSLYTRLACMSMQLYSCAITKINSNRRAPQYAENFTGGDLECLHLTS